MIALEPCLYGQRQLTARALTDEQQRTSRMFPLPHGNIRQFLGVVVFFHMLAQIFFCGVKVLFDEPAACFAYGLWRRFTASSLYVIAYSRVCVIVAISGCAGVMNWRYGSAWSPRSNMLI